MPITHDKLKARLKKQQEIEGYTPETALLLELIALKIVKTSNDWQNLTNVRHHRYGEAYYHFYYPSETLLKLKALFEESNDTTKW